MALAELHDRAPVHSWKASKSEIEKAFGQPVEELFDSIEHKALASGSIAQVWLLQTCRNGVYDAVLCAGLRVYAVKFGL